MGKGGPKGNDIQQFIYLSRCEAGMRQGLLPGGRNQGGNHQKVYKKVAYRFPIAIPSNYRLP